MHFIVAGLFLIGLMMLPQLWNSALMKHYQRERKDIRNTGGELAQQLIHELKLNGVGVESTREGDHYDPDARMVRLSQKNHDGHCLTAIAVAAHEVGHAMQHHRQEPAFMRRNRMVRLASRVERYGVYVMFAVPLLAVMTRHPAPSILSFLIGLVTLASTTVVHFITLPVELDASFNKALPILKSGTHITYRDEQAIHRILRAAALTYVAASLFGLLNVWRWLRLIRR